MIMMINLPAFCSKDDTVTYNNDDDGDGNENLRAAAKVVETTPVAQAA